MKKPKSSIEDLKDIFEKNIKARHITEPLYSFDSSADAQQVKKIMYEKDYDVIGIRDGGIIQGYAVRGDLDKGQLGIYFRNFNEQEILPDNATVDEVFDKIKIYDHIFITAFDRVSGIISLGDLEKIPVRMWLFSLVSLIEMQMLRIIRNKFPGNSWKKFISSEERLSDAEEIFKELRNKNKAIELVDCLQFCDKRDIILENPDILKQLKYSKNKFDELLKDLEDLRNNLAHAQSIITYQWPKAITLSKTAEKLLTRFEAIN